MAQMLLQDAVVHATQEHGHRVTMLKTLHRRLRPLDARGSEHALYDVTTYGAVYRPPRINLRLPL